MKRAQGAKEMFHIPWKDLVYYCETSPTGLRHKNKITYGNGNTLTKAEAGDIAGSITDSYYSVLTLSKYGTFQVHRIIWILTSGEDIPIDCVIDHIDGNILNNNINNLRLVKSCRNARNAKMYKNNTTNIVGVYFDTKCYKDTIPRHYWKASWMELDGSQKTKAFSVEKHGLIPAMSMAFLYRKEMIAKLNSQDAGYTERHGT